MIVASALIVNPRSRTGCKVVKSLFGKVAPIIHFRIIMSTIIFRIRIIFRKDKGFQGFVRLKDVQDYFIGILFWLLCRVSLFPGVKVFRGSPLGPCVLFAGTEGLLFHLQ